MALRVGLPTGDCRRQWDRPVACSSLLARFVAVWALVALTWMGGAAPFASAEEDAPAETAGAVWRSAGSAGLKIRGLSSLGIHPKDSSLLWAHVHGMGPAVSEDGGRTWTARLDGIPEKLLPGLRSQVRISFDPQKAKTLYVVIDGQIFRTEDDGARWDSVTSGALTSLSWNKLNSAHLAWQVEVDPKKSVRLLVGTRNDGDHNGGLFESKNSGLAWEQVSGTDIPKSGLGNDTFLIRQDPKSDKYVTVAGRRSLWRSDDVGRTFERNDPGGEGGIHDYRDISYPQSGMKELYLADARGVWRSKDGGRKWDKEPVLPGDALAIVVDAHNRKRVYTVMHDTGLWVSEDPRKAKWEQLGGVFGKVEEGVENPPLGYRDAVIREVVAHPRERRTMFLASPVTGLHVSLDAGQTFAPVAPPEDAKAGTVIPEIMPALTLCAVHPARGGEHLCISTDGVVFASADGGTTWSVRGRLGQAPGILQADKAPHTWWAAGRRLLRSTDDGATWEAVGPVGVDEKRDAEERIVALHRSAPAEAGKPGVLRILLERSGVVLASADDGVTWSETKGPWKPAKGDGDRTWAVALAVNPANGDHMVIAARTTREAPSRSDENGGIFETWDAGKTWTEIAGDLRPGKKDTVAALRTKANWNRAALLGIDSGSGLLVYGANGRGLFTRAIANPKDKKAEAPTWVDVTPKVPERPQILVGLFARSDDGEDSRLIVQLAGENEELALYAIEGAMLKSLHDLRSGVEGALEDADWTAMASPGATVRLSSLSADANAPARLLGTDALTDRGVLIYEDPTAKQARVPVKKDEPKKDEPKKDEPKKDEPKKDEPKKDDESAPEVPGQAPAAVAPPEGMRAFTCGADKSLRFWRVDQGKSTQEVAGHDGAIACVVLSPDEQFLLTGGADKQVRLWKAASGAALSTLPTEAGVLALVVDDSSRFAYVALDEKKQVLQLDLSAKDPAGLLVRAFEGHGDGVTALAVSEDVNRVYSGSRDQSVRVWDTQSGMQVNEIAVGSPVTGLAVASDGARIYAVGADNQLHVFDATGTAVAAIALGAPVHALRLSPDGATLYCATTGGVRALPTDPAAGTGITLEAKDRTIHGLSLSADGIWVLGGDEQGGLWLWAAATPAARWTRPGHEGPLLGIAVSPDETVVGAAAVPALGEKPGAGDQPAGDGKPEEGATPPGG